MQFPDLSTINVIDTKKGKRKRAMLPLSSHAADKLQMATFTQAAVYLRQEGEGGGGGTSFFLRHIPKAWAAGRLIFLVCNHRLREGPLTTKIQSVPFFNLTPFRHRVHSWMHAPLSLSLSPGCVSHCLPD